MSEFELLTIPKGDWLNFLVTYFCIILFTTPLGLLTYWIFEKDNKEKDDSDGQDHKSSI